MIDPISSLLGSLPGTNSIKASPLDTGGFGPDFIVDIGNEHFAGTPGYASVISLSNAGMNAVQQQANQRLSSPQIYSQEQLVELQQIVNDTASAMARGDFDTAEARAKDLLKRDAFDPLGSHLLGRIEMARGDFREAIGHFERAVQLDPTNERFDEDLFIARQLDNGADQALAFADQLVQNPQTAYRGVRLLFEAAPLSSGGQGRAYLGVAKGLETLGLPSQQLNAFEVVLEVGTESDLEQLEKDITGFISDNEPVGLAYSLLGRTQQELGRLDEAAAALQAARNIAPETERYTSEYARIQADIGLKNLESGNLSGAKYRLQTAHDLDPDNDAISVDYAKVMITRAESELSRGLENNARSSLSRAKSLIGDDTSLHEALGMNYFLIGQRAEAKGEDGLAELDYINAQSFAPDINGLDRKLSDIYRGNAVEILEGRTIDDLNTSEFEALVDNYQRAYDLQSHNPTYKADLGEALNSFGLKLMNENEDYDRAVEIFDRARDLFPDNTTYQANYSQALGLQIAEEAEE